MRDTLSSIATWIVMILVFVALSAGCYAMSETPANQVNWMPSSGHDYPLPGE